VSLAPTLRQPSPSSSRASFADLLQEGANILSVERTLEASVAEAMDDVAQGEVFEHSATLDSRRPKLDALLEPIANPIARRFLEQDIAWLAESYGALLERRHLHGQLAVVAHDACRKLHVDNVTIRLLCTYAGPGTQWVPNEDVVRENLARIDVDLEEANRSVLRHADAVRQCKAGDVLLLKGEAFRRNRGFGAVHRSPPIAARDLRRLVFKIDERPCGC
jgi:hypothetical protein